MKAIAVKPSNKSINLIEIDEPSISASNDIKIKILDVGLCGTDREICGFEYGTPPKGDDYLVIGHESIGEVVEVGTSVTSFKVGDIVVPTVRRGCPENCVSCANNESDMCFTGNFTERGINGRHGFMAEYIIEEEKNLIRIPTEIRSYGVLLEPLTITEKALIQLDSIQRRLRWECVLKKGTYHYGCRRALVLGAGPVGILAALAFANRGFHTSIFSRVKEGSPLPALLKKAGVYILPASEYDAEKIATTVGEFDLVYEATGASQMAFEMIRTLGINGIYFFTGVPGRKHPFEFDASSAMRQLVLKNQILIGTVNANRTAFENGVTDLIDFEKKFPGVATSLITKRVKPEEVIPYLHERKAGEIKTVLSF